MFHAVITRWHKAQHLLQQWSAREPLQAKTSLSARIFNFEGQKYCTIYCRRSHDSDWQVKKQKSQTKNRRFLWRVDTIHRVVTGRDLVTFEKHNLAASGLLRCASTESLSAINCCRWCHPSSLSKVACLLLSDGATYLWPGRAAAPVTFQP